MNDIFLSYASEDRKRVRKLAKHLERQGWIVWWDREIPVGKSYDNVIERALDDSRCVIVFWSKQSIGSDWVKNEADEGLRRGILIPVITDHVKPPLAFRRVQAAVLNDWDGDPVHPGVADVIEAVRSILGGRTAVDPEPEDETEAETAHTATTRLGTPVSVRRALFDGALCGVAGGGFGTVTALVIGSALPLAVMSTMLSWAVASMLTRRGNANALSAAGSATAIAMGWAGTFGVHGGTALSATEGLLLGGIAGPIAGALLSVWRATRP